MVVGGTRRLDGVPHKANMDLPGDGGQLTIFVLHHSDVGWRRTLRPRPQGVTCLINTHIHTYTHAHAMPVGLTSRRAHDCCVVDEGELPYLPLLISFSDRSSLLAMSCWAARCCLLSCCLRRTCRHPKNHGGV